jgi:chromosome segregation ATPase
MQKYSIDVDNLCSFMPQDKVGEFSRFNHREMLQNTLKSVTNRTAEGKCLYEEQMELSNMEKGKDEYRRNKAAKEVRVSQLQKEFAALDAEVEKLRQREQFQETLDLCTIKQVNMDVAEHQAACEW